LYSNSDPSVVQLAASVYTDCATAVVSRQCKVYFKAIKIVGGYIAAFGSCFNNNIVKFPGMDKGKVCGT
jgi:hypothetical protein